MAPRTARLELETDDGFQRLEWRVQRVGWIIWFLLVMAALLGVLGPGWLSDTEVTSGDGRLNVAYERFLHYHSPSQIQMVINANADADGQWQIKIGRSLLDRLEISGIIPEPERREIADDGVVYTFLSRPQSAQGKVIFHVEYERYGRTEGQVSLLGSDAVTLSQFVYP
jgi:hypothetical protein